MQRKAQVWIETVIYLLIGLAIMGILLSIITPEIEKKKDQAFIEQSIEMLNAIDKQVEDVRWYGAGNSRPFEIKIRKGKFTINGKDDAIEFLIDSKYEYSQVGQEVESGKIKILTEKKTKGYDVSLKIDYASSMNITYQRKDISQVFQPAPTPYSIVVVNNGKTGDLINIDFS